MSDNYLEMLLKELHRNRVSLRKPPFNPDKFTVDELELEAIGTESFSFLDFSEHDKVFEDKIASLENQIAYMKEKKNYLRTRCMEDATDAFDSGAYGRLTIVGRRVDLETENDKLKQRIAELESKETETLSDIDTSNPLACAESLIEHMTHCEKFMIMPERDVQTFSVEELKEIADYLMVYYRHHRDKDVEETISF